MFSFLSKPQQVELLEVDGRELGFRSQKENAVGQTIKVRVLIPGIAELTLPITVKCCRPGDYGFLCYGTVPTSKGLEKFTEQLPGPKAGEKLRKDQRYPVGIRILSPELPSFKAITVDFSKTGLQLEAEGDVPLGTMLTLTLETEMKRLSSVICRAKVIWCRPTGQFQRCRVGLEFAQLENKMRSDLDKFESYLRERFK